MHEHGEPRPGPQYPAAIDATAAARSDDAVSSAAMTSASALVALSRGRPKAKIDHEPPVARTCQRQITVSTKSPRMSPQGSCAGVRSGRRCR